MWMDQVRYLSRNCWRNQPSVGSLCTKNFTWKYASMTYQNFFFIDFKFFLQNLVCIGIPEICSRLDVFPLHHFDFSSLCVPWQADLWRMWKEVWRFISSQEYFQFWNNVQEQTSWIICVPLFTKWYLLGILNSLSKITSGGYYWLLQGQIKDLHFRITTLKS